MGISGSDNLALESDTAAMGSTCFIPILLLYAAFLDRQISILGLQPRMLTNVNKERPRKAFKTRQSSPDVSRRGLLRGHRFAQSSKGDRDFLESLGVAIHA